MIIFSRRGHLFDTNSAPPAIPQALCCVVYVVFASVEERRTKNKSRKYFSRKNKLENE